VVQKGKEFTNIRDDDSIIWNADGFSSGIYLYQFSSDDYKLNVRKMILLN